MIDTLLIGILKLITYIINLTLLPINLLIENYIPNLDNILNGINNLFNMLGGYIGWIFEALCLESYTISMLVLVLTFKLTFPIIIHTIKIIVKWYNKLKV